MCFLKPDHREPSLDVVEQYRIPNNITVLGRGEISEVVLGFDTLNENKPVAIKKIAKAHLKRFPKMQQKLQQEIVILQKVALIDSDLFVRFYDTYEDTDFVYIVTEYVEGGELYDLVEKFPYGVPELLGRTVLKQIVEGVSLLHKHNIVHLDLKLENIMFNSDTDKIKIIDFGYATTVAGNLSEYCGSTHYIAPQILHHIPYDGFKADSWSLGVITFGLLASRFPFDDENDNQKEIIFKIKKGSYVAPSHFSTQAVSFIQAVLNPNEISRLDTFGMLNHPFLRV